jgi:hypothetical protein
VLEPALCLGLDPAPAAGSQMGQHTLARLVSQLAVHQGGEPVTEVLFGRRRT